MIILSTVVSLFICSSFVSFVYFQTIKPAKTVAVYRPLQFSCVYFHVVFGLVHYLVALIRIN